MLLSGLPLLGSGQSQEVHSRAREPKSWISGWRTAKEGLSESGIVGELAEGRELKRVVPQSDLLTFGLTSKLVIVNLIINGMPTALRFALWKRSHCPGPTLDNGLHTHMGQIQMTWQSL